MTLTTKEILLARLPRTEGRKARPYKDIVGKWTVGVGHNISDKGLPGYAVEDLLNFGQLTDKSIDRLLADDVDEVLRDTSTIKCFDALTNARKSVLADMVFNMGLGSVLGFVNTLNFISQGKFSEAADQMLKSKWAEQVGNRAIELAKIMRDGEIKSPSSLVG